MRSDGQVRWLQGAGVVQRDAAGRAVQFVGVSIDITARRRAQQALLEADRRKDEFLAMLAHELRNPLARSVTACRSCACGLLPTLRYNVPWT